MSDAARKPIDWWRWSGRVFLLFLLIFTILPMLWMVLTSLKPQFAAMSPGQSVANSAK